MRNPQCPISLERLQQTDELFFDSVEAYASPSIDDYTELFQLVAMSNCTGKLTDLISRSDARQPSLCRTDIFSGASIALSDSMSVSSLKDGSKLCTLFLSRDTL